MSNKTKLPNFQPYPRPCELEEFSREILLVCVSPRRKVRRLRKLLAEREGEMVVKKERGDPK